MKLIIATVAICFVVVISRAEGRSIEELMKEIEELETHIAKHEGNIAEQEGKLNHDLEEMISKMTPEQRTAWEEKHPDVLRHWEQIKHHHQ